MHILIVLADESQKNKNRGQAEVYLWVHIQECRTKVSYENDHVALKSTRVLVHHIRERENLRHDMTYFIIFLNNTQEDIQ